MTLTLEQITPERIRELSNERDEQKLLSLVRTEVMRLADEFEVAKSFAEEMLARCQIRAWKMHNLGVEKDELATLFNVSERTIAQWLKSPVSVVMTGGN